MLIIIIFRGINIETLNNNDYIGVKYGHLTILDIYINENRNKIAKCLCDCGNIIEKRLYDVKDGKIVSCKHCDSILLLNKQFGDLIVKNTLYEGNMLWCECYCTCGNPTPVKILASNLKRGNTKRCGKCQSFLMLNKKYHELTVLQTFYKKDKNGKNILWCNCACSCGNTTEIRANALKTGRIKTCGKCLEHKLINNIYGELKVIYTFHKVNDKTSKNELWCHCICSCGNELDVRARSLIRKNNPQISCGCLSVSKGQLIIEEWLSNHKIEYSKEENFNKDPELKTLKNGYLRYDLYLPLYNLIIEFDGIQHFLPVECWGGKDQLISTQNNDALKDKWAKEHGIQLIRFNYKQSQTDIERNLELLLQGYESRKKYI